MQNREKRKQARSKGKRTMPKFRNKNQYLMGVGARGKVKDKLTGCYLANPIDIQSKNKNNDKTGDNKNLKKRILHSKRIKTVVKKGSPN